MKHKSKVSTDPLKQFIVRKLVMATDAQDAISKESGTRVHEVYVDTDYKPATASPELGYK